MSADGNRTGRFFYILKNMGSADTQVSPNSLIQYIVVYMTVKKGHLSKSKFLLLNTIRQQNYCNSNSNLCLGTFSEMHTHTQFSHKAISLNWLGH